MTADECRTRIRRMASLQPGWDSYGAEPPSEAARANALAFCLAACEFRIVEHVEASGMGGMGVTLHAFEPARVAPSVVGGVGVSVRDSERRVYVEFYNRGTACALFADDATKEMHTAPVPVGGSYAQTLTAIAAYLRGNGGLNR